MTPTPHSDRKSQFAGWIRDIGHIAFHLSDFLFAAVLTAVALVILRCAALPRWLGWSSALLAAFVAITRALPNEVYGVESIGYLEAGLSLAWYVVMSILMFPYTRASLDDTPGGIRGAVMTTSTTCRR